MDLSKEFQSELERRKTELERRKTLEALENATPKDFEVVKSIALSLYRQSEALRKMLLMKMKEELEGRV